MSDPDGVICLGDGGTLARALISAGGWRPAGGASERLDGSLWRALGGPSGVEVGKVRFAGDGFWSRLLVVEATSRSQFDALAEATAAGLRLPGPVAAVAGTGRGFHGQRGRPWLASPGNLHLSVAIPLTEAVRASESLAYTLLPAVAAHDAILKASRGRTRPEIQWVNDLLLDGRKVGGVLTRTRVVGESTELVLLGIGINVRSAPEVAATPFVPAAGTVPDVTLPDLLYTILESLALRYRELLSSGIGPLFSGYRAACRLPGQRVRVYPSDVDETAPPSRWPEPLAAGVVQGIRDDLALLIDGVPPVKSGRLAREESCRAFGLARPGASRPDGRFPS